jgi:small subunit ribosomal protein S16
MLTIRLQRGGRSGHPQYRVVVQDSRFTPTSGRVVESVGTYNPHTKEFNVVVEKVEKHLANGAQPSDRVARLLDKAGVTLPSWVKLSTSTKPKSVKNSGKLRRNTPVEEKVEELVAEEVVAEETEAITPEEPEAEATAEA